MNFAKYIVAHILAKFKYFAKQTLLLNSPARKLYIDISLVYFSTSFVLIEISKNGPKWTHFAKIACKIAKSKYF